MSDRKQEFTLSDGRKVVIDLYKISIGEYREFWKSENEREAEIMAKVIDGLSEEDIPNLSYGDWADLVKAIRETALGQSGSAVNGNKKKAEASKQKS